MHVCVHACMCPSTLCRKTGGGDGCMCGCESGCVSVCVCLAWIRDWHLAAKCTTLTWYSLPRNLPITVPNKLLNLLKQNTYWSFHRALNKFSNLVLNLEIHIHIFCIHMLMLQQLSAWWWYLRSQARLFALILYVQACCCHLHYFSGALGTWFTVLYVVIMIFSKSLCQINSALFIL